MILIWIPLITKDIEYVFLYLFASYVITLAKYLFLSFAPFFNK